MLSLVPRISSSSQVLLVSISSRQFFFFFFPFLLLSRKTENLDAVRQVSTGNLVTAAAIERKQPLKNRLTRGLGSHESRETDRQPQVDTGKDRAAVFCRLTSVRGSCLLSR